MPTWLVLSWALTVGYCPTYNQELVYPVSLDYIEYNHPGSFIQNIHLQAEAFGHMRLVSDLETRDKFNPDYPGFLPFVSTYTLYGEIYTPALTLGVKHSCTHSVISGFRTLPSPGLGGNETQIYLRIEGK